MDDFDKAVKAAVASWLITPRINAGGQEEGIRAYLHRKMAAALKAALPYLKRLP